MLALAGLLLAVLAGPGLRAQERTLVVGSEVDFPPFALGTTDAEADGFTVELWRAVAQEMGLQHRIRVRPFGELLQEFRDGRIDVLINLAQSPARAEFAEFAVPNVVAYGAVFAREGSLQFQSEDELKDKSIIVLRADLPHDYAKAAGYRRLVPVDDVAAAMRLLASGQHDGVLVSRLVGLMTIKELGLRGIVPVGEPVRGVVQRFSFAVRKGNLELLAQINEGLALTRTNGRFQAIYEKWFAPIDPQRPTLSQLSRYLVPAAALVLLSFGLFLYQRRVAARLGQAAQELAEREGSLALAQQVAQMGNWTWRRTPPSLQWSDELRRLHGLGDGVPASRDDFLSRVHADDRQTVAQRVDAALEQGTPFELEYRLELPGPVERFVHHRVEPVESGGARMVGTVLDITQRKRDEALQRDQRRLLERIAEGEPLPGLLNAVLESLEAQLPGAMGGVLLLDDSGQVLRNAAGDRLPAGYREGLEGLRIGPEAGACGTACHRREPVITTDIGTDPLWAAFRDVALSHGIRACWSQPIIGSNGTVLGSLSLSHDHPRTPQAADLRLLATQAHIAALAIERRRAEAALAQLNSTLETRVAERTAQLEAEVDERARAQQAYAAARDFLDNVLNALRDAVFVKDLQQRWVLLNDAACELIGQPRDQLLAAGGSGGAVVAGGVADAAWASGGGTGAHAGEPDEAEEYAITDTAGAQRWLQVRRSRYVEPGGRVLLVGMARDITERKRSEIELRNAKEAAESAAHAKSEFLANMSHEIRTPLHGVLGAMEMLADTPLSGQQQRFIETASTSANILLGVIDEILDFSRLEGGKLRIETLDFDLHRTVEDVTAVLAQRAHAKHIELACYIAPEVPHMVSGDPVRLRQVLVNLIGNAIKFTQRGEVVVSCSTAPHPLHGRNMLRVEVRDTGIGIPESKKPMMFEPFMQADASTSRQFGGSGLGLSISRRLITLMGGTIDYQSEQGRGSRFWFELPLVPALTRDDAARATTLAGTRVLVIDDNATNRIILHRYLTAWSAQSGSASAGDEALAKLQDAALSGHPYDLVLLDLNMPGMDGYALLGHLQADPHLAGLPVIMLSSSIQDPVRLAGLRVDVWLDKPVRQSDLHDAIATVLGRQRVQAPAPARQPPRSFRGERVLLAEDNITTRELGTQMLRNQGLQVEVAENGEQAVAAVQQRAFDLVLMDIQMPGLDGYQATARIRAWEAEHGRTRLPIIALTAHALPADRQRCLDAGMDDYVVKPYKAATLGAAIARWLMPPGHAAALSSSVPEVIDAERLQEVRMMMNDEFVALMVTAARSLQRLADAVRTAQAAGDTPALADAVHRIRNTAGDVGASRLQEAAAGIERRLADTRAGDADVAPLLAETAAAVQALQALAGG